MPAWLRRLRPLRLALREAAGARRLHRDENAPARQDRAFAALVPPLARASHWAAAGLEPGIDYATFRRRLPLTTPAALAPQVDRMRRGEANVLWPGPCTRFVHSAGTATGEARLLPVTDALGEHFRHAHEAVLLHARLWSGRHGLLAAPHLFLGAPPAPTAAPPPWPATDPFTLFGATAAAAEAGHRFLPGPPSAPAALWADQLDDAAAAAAAWPQAPGLLAGLPDQLAAFGQRVLAHAGRAGRPARHLRELWPDLIGCLHTGLPLVSCAAELRAVLGPGSLLQEVYAAVEGLFACQDSPRPEDGLRLITGSGLFFEFLPWADHDPALPASLGTRALPLEEVRPGVDYALVVTTPGGLVRTLVGDLVRFTSVEPPRLLPIGRIEHQLTRFGEEVSERDLTTCLAGVCTRHGWNLVQFHVASRPDEAAAAGLARGHHEWWVELRAGTVATPTGPHLAQELDDALQGLNPGYAARRRTGKISAPVVRLVMPGVFATWLRAEGREGGFHRVPRSANDLRCAAPLARLTHFAD